MMRRRIGFGRDVSWFYLLAARRRYLFEIILTDNRFSGLLLNVLASSAGHRPAIPGIFLKRLKAL